MHNDSTSQLDAQSSTPTPSTPWRRPPAPPGIKVIDKCIVVENTRECLDKLVEHFKIVVP